MNSAAIDPRASRGLLKTRLFESTVIISAMFILAVVVFSWILSRISPSFVPMLLADGIAGLIAYYAYLRWNQQPIRILCNGCHGKILCNTPWICGECGHENFNIRKFPFLRHCEHCELEPKSYVCHHCDRVIFLSEDRDPNNPARRIAGEGRRKKQEGEGEAKRKVQFEEAQAVRKQSLEGKKLDFEEAKLNAMIEAVKKGEPEVVIPNQMDVLFESLGGYVDRRLAIQETVRRMKELFNEKYKGKPAEIRRRHLIVDDWGRMKLLDAQKNPPQ
jgi:hypothetical protein